MAALFSNHITLIPLQLTRTTVAHLMNQWPALIEQNPARGACAHG
jgi:hypothetical protein